MIYAVQLSFERDSSGSDSRVCGIGWEVARVTNSIISRGREDAFCDVLLKFVSRRNLTLPIVAIGHCGIRVDRQVTFP